MRQGDDPLPDVTRKIEVAFFKSILFDAAGAEDEGRKGNTPKEEIVCRSILGHMVKSHMTVIRFTDGALSERILQDSFAGAFVSAIIFAEKERKVPGALFMRRKRYGDF